MGETAPTTKGEKIMIKVKKQKNGAVILTLENKKENIDTLIENSNEIYDDLEMNDIYPVSIYDWFYFMDYNQNILLTSYYPYFDYVNNISGYIMGVLVDEKQFILQPVDEQQELLLALNKSCGWGNN